MVDQPRGDDAEAEGAARLKAILAWTYEDLTPAEVLWVGTLLARLKERRGFSLGIFGDFVVATALPGAVPSRGGTDRYDMTWRGIKIEVKSRSTRRPWTINPAYGRDPDNNRVCRLWADVYVLAQHDGSDHRIGWSFYVVPRIWLDPNPVHGTPISIGETELRAWHLRPVDVDGLNRAVLAASKALARNGGPSS